MGVGAYYSQIDENYGGGVVIEYGALFETGAVAASVAAQQAGGFTDPGVIAIIEMCRIGARFLIMLTVILAAGHWAYGGFLLYSSGGDPRRISAGQDVIKNTLFGVVVAVSGYLIITSVVNLYVGIAGLDGIILFRSSQLTTEFSIENLLKEEEIALRGEVIYFEGSRAHICEPSLSDGASESGWDYFPTLPGANHLSGCIRGGGADKADKDDKNDGT